MEAKMGHFVNINIALLWLWLIANARYSTKSANRANPWGVSRVLPSVLTNTFDTIWKDASLSNRISIQNPQFARQWTRLTVSSDHLKRLKGLFVALRNHFSTRRRFFGILQKGLCQVQNSENKARFTINLKKSVARGCPALETTTRLSMSFSALPRLTISRQSFSTFDVWYSTFK